MKQRRKNRRKFYLFIAVSCLLLLLGGSYLVYAAMTAEDNKENDFLIGQVETELDEVFNEDIQEIKKNTSVTKTVKVKNTGTINQFIRVMILPEVRTSIAGDPGNYQILSLKLGTDLILEGLDATEWVDGEDGYYYYIKEALEPGKPTTALFEKIRLSDQISDQYHDATFTISLKVETINCAKHVYRDAWWQGVVPSVNGDPLKIVDEALTGKTEN